MQYLVDTGVWLRLFDRTDAEHANIREALRRLRVSGHLLTICPQNIAEFWNVSTRATTARGGYGKSVATTERRAQFIERFGIVLEESPDAYAKWRALLVGYQIQGLAVHDARLVGMMLSAGITQILTLNVGDFARYQDQEIVAVTPVRVVTAGNS